MSKPRPNIPVVPFNDRTRYKNLVLEVLDDMVVYTYQPDSISLNGVLFTLTLSNKKFVYEEIKVDDISEYVDVYLQGVKKTANTYSVSVSGNDILLVFNQAITLNPQLITKEDFVVKGKIVEI